MFVLISIKIHFYSDYSISIRRLTASMITKIACVTVRNFEGRIQRSGVWEAETHFFSEGGGGGGIIKKNKNPILKCKI